MSANRRTVARDLMRKEDRFFGELSERYGQLSWFSVAHWRILMSLWNREGHRATQTEAKKVIAKMNGYRSDSKRRQAIDKLVSAKFVVRQPHETDRRVDWIVLTNEAKEQIEKYLDKLADQIEESAVQLKKIQS